MHILLTSIALSAAMTVMAWRGGRALCRGIAERTIFAFLMSSPFWAVSLIIAAEIAHHH